MSWMPRRRERESAYSCANDSGSLEVVEHLPQIVFRERCFLVLVQDGLVGLAGDL